jgi:hypothetical protein
LLKATRVIYNIFIISKSAHIQTVAQATLTQVSHSVFSRVPKKWDFKEIMKNHKDKMKQRDGPKKTKILAEQEPSNEEPFNDPITISSVQGKRDLLNS